jgi:hypothetical protein
LDGRGLRQPERDLQVGVLPAFRVWALIVIGLDVIVIYGLTARWEERA